MVVQLIKYRTSHKKSQDNSVIIHLDSVRVLLTSNRVSVEEHILLTSLCVAETLTHTQNLFHHKSNSPMQIALKMADRRLQQKVHQTIC